MHAQPLTQETNLPLFPLQAVYTVLYGSIHINRLRYPWVQDPHIRNRPKEWIQSPTSGDQLQVVKRYWWGNPRKAMNQASILKTGYTTHTTFIPILPTNPLTRKYTERSPHTNTYTTTYTNTSTHTHPQIPHPEDPALLAVRDSHTLRSGTSNYSRVSIYLSN